MIQSLSDAKKQIERVKTNSGEGVMGRDMKKPGPAQLPVKDEVAEQRETRQSGPVRGPFAKGQAGY